MLSMRNESRYVCLVETRRLLLLTGVIFGLILFVQYIELPYGNILSSLFASGKSQVAVTNNFPSKNLSSSLNFTDFTITDGESNSTMVSDGKDSNMTNLTDDFDPDKTKSLDDFQNEDIDPENEYPPTDFLKMKQNSTFGSTVTNNELLVLNHTSRSNASLEGEISNQGNVSFISSIPEVERFDELEPEVISLNKMNNLLLQSRVSHGAMRLHWPSTVDHELLIVKRIIENTSIIEEDLHIYVDLYRNFSEFKRSYELMEQTLKVYIYAEGKRPIFHQPPLKGIYASEGWFMKLLKANKKFITKNPKKAHLFYLPFSSRMLEETLYQPNSHSRDNLIQYLSNYIELITTKYNFWNRTDGTDHFLVACHDWAPVETKKIMENCIRALCNADMKEGFLFGKDVSLPETLVQSPQNPLRQIGGKPPSQRQILAFFAGNMHGYVRPMLLKHWKNKDPEMKIFGTIRKRKGEMSYAQYMKSSKYCICAKGYEVNSPRVVEAIFYDCVPVIISDNFVPPFFETLNWESFAVFVLEKDIPNLKKILLSISNRSYLKMQERVKQVQQHFLWHSRPVKYDVFHMILHSVWYNRVFRTRES